MYKNGIYITDPKGNNEFSYPARIRLGSQGKIFVTNLIHGSKDDLEEGSEIVFEEVQEEKLISCTGLKHFLQTTYMGIPTYIFDNHNHALFFRYRHTKQFQHQEDAKPFHVIHIDQHADTKNNPNSFNATYASVQEVIGFANYACNVGNFLSSAREAGIIEGITQIRSTYALHHLQPLDFLNYNYILDIDIDFWEDKSAEERTADFATIRQLIKNACLITIATSPYFIDQTQAIAITKQLLQ